MNNIITHTLSTPAGILLTGSYKDRICLCDWKFRKMRTRVDRRIKEGLKADYLEGHSDVLSRLETQLHEYFQKKRKKFDIPIILIGTAFQKEVWHTLLSILYGETETYSGLAARINKAGATRAVASANGANALSIIVPCHRIISSNGAPGGYAGGIEAKQKLLNLEARPMLEGLDESPCNVMYNKKNYICKI